MTEEKKTEYPEEVYVEAGNSIFITEEEYFDGSVKYIREDIVELKLELAEYSEE